MKRIISFSLSLIIVFLFCACREKEEPDNSQVGKSVVKVEDETTEEPSTTETETTALETTTEEPTTVAPTTEIITTTNKVTTTQTPITVKVTTTQRPTTTKRVTTTAKPVTTTKKYIFVQLPTITKASTTKTTTNSGSSLAVSSNPSSVTLQLFDLTNQERIRYGKEKLQWNDTLYFLANVRVKEAARNFSHTRPNGRPWDTVFDDYNVTGFIRKGENLQYNSSRNSALEANESLMNSKSHRDNILGDYDCIGISSYYDSSTGRTYFCQLFGKTS